MGKNRLLQHAWQVIVNLFNRPLGSSYRDHDKTAPRILDTAWNSHWQDAIIITRCFLSTDGTHPGTGQSRGLAVASQTHHLKRALEADHL
jgi:hypothetical protein